MQLRIGNPARTARRTTLITVPLVIAVSGTALAHGGGGMMGGGWGLVGGAMGLWGLLWVGFLFAVPAFLVYTLVTRRGRSTDDALSSLRVRYARGELSADEFERRRDRLDRAR